jgi:nicotinic acetylcholine receptor
MLQRWKDEFLTWNPSDFHNITEMVVPFAKVWQPDLLIQETCVFIPNTQHKYHSFNFNRITESIHAVLHYNGTLAASWVDVITLRCQMNVAEFPFDKQTCKFKYVAWVHKSTEVEIIPEVINFDYYLPNSGYNHNIYQ